ncbi:M50 family metallopeptidase [Cutibacterium modestum]|uniref:M50 family metallopeptidase n=1 Tax=Cutibacterium modestum TaxID=2559073 RepID=UPI0020A59B29|nr:site-2 protease family protein [Cutibacterium modestum]MCP2377312.1 putative RIP metalloprotease RseP [Cutibacterium modestum 31N]
MTVVIEVLAGIVFFSLIILSVLLHECGHFIPAKIFGVKVTEFFAGFGPKIWSFTRGETEYGFKWIPLGGYVRLVGMYPATVHHHHGNRLTKLADEARAAEAEDITGADRGRLFSDKPVWQRLIIMSGGILTNLLMAFLLFWAVFGIHGRAAQTTTVAAVTPCVHSSQISGPCPSGDRRAPAAEAGVQAGDRIVSFNGRQVDSWSQLQEFIRDNGDGEARLGVKRHGDAVSLMPTRTLVTEVPDLNNPGRTVEAGYLGVSPTMVVVHSGPGDTVSQMWTMSKQSLSALARLPVLTWNVASDMVTGKARDANSPMSIVGASRVAGDVAGNSQLTMGDKIATGASLLGGLNLFLFWFNVVPLPPMDGGHIAGAIYEACKRGLFKLAGKPDPGPADTAMMLPVAWTIGALMLVMGLILVVADVVSPVKIF